MLLLRRLEMSMKRINRKFVTPVQHIPFCARAVETMFIRMELSVGLSLLPPIQRLWFDEHETFGCELMDKSDSYKH